MSIQTYVLPSATTNVITFVNRCLCFKFLYSLMTQAWLPIKIFEFILLQYIIPMLTYVLPATTTNFILPTPIKFVMVDGNTYVNNKEFLCITHTNTTIFHLVVLLGEIQLCLIVCAINKNSLLLNQHNGGDAPQNYICQYSILHQPS